MKIRTLSATIAMLMAPAIHAELFISEYVEGSGNNKALELFNPGTESIALSDYSIQVYFNGNTNVGTTISLSGSVAAGDTFVLSDNDAVIALRQLADIEVTQSLWNGDDAITLSKNGVVVDSIGQIGVDPGSAWGSGDTTTANHTLRRRSVSYDTNPHNTFDPAEQWQGFAQDEFSHIGLFNGNDGGPGDPGPDPDPLPELSCGEPATAIYQVQGSGDSTPLAGETVQVEAIVAQTLPALKGYMLQTAEAEQDNDPATSEGVFVYINSSDIPVSVGQRIRIEAVANEYFGQTQLSNLTGWIDCGTGALSDPAVLQLPLTDLSQLEAVEGMQVVFNQQLTVNDVNRLGQYGEVVLSNGRRYIPTQVVSPGAEAQQLAEQHRLNRIVLDDNSTVSYPDTIVYPAPELSASNTLRTGDVVTQLRGGLYYSFNEYRVMPVAPVNFIAANQRTAIPELTAGNVSVGSFNVLNYFNGDGMGAGFPTSRGADSLIEFERQRAKIIEAITALNASVVGLMEIENDGFGEYSAIADLVTGIRQHSGQDDWQFVQTTVSPIGTDQIAVGMLYRASLVEPVASARLLTSANSPLDDNGVPLFDDRRNRPALAQQFRLLDNNAEFVVIVNHLKSKGGSCGADDPDTGDGQGSCNLTRTRAAEGLAVWSNSEFSDLPVLLIGDMNAYAKEDPIQTFASEGYISVFETLGKTDAYGYVFAGQAGQLDHALANDVARQYLLDAADWHINADEPPVLDYNTERKTAQQLLDLYSADAYRSSDHDPVIVSFNLPEPVVPIEAQLEVVRTVRARFGQSLVQLRWSSAESNLVLYRNNEPQRMLRRPGLVNDAFRSELTEFTYKICQQGTERCSEELVVELNR